MAAEERMRAKWDPLGYMEGKKENLSPDDGGSGQLRWGAVECAYHRCFTQLAVKDSEQRPISPIERLRETSLEYEI